MKKHKILKAVGFYFSIFAITTAVASAAFYASYKREAGQAKPAPAAEKMPDLTLVTPTKQTEKPTKLPNQYEEKTEEKSQEAENPLVFKMPTFGEIISGFNDQTLEYSKHYDDWRTHPSIDFDTSANSEVWASADGEVIKIYDHPIYGKTVVIKHGENITTTYAPISPNEKIVLGAKISAGETIGVCTNSLLGDKILHFEAKNGEKPYNPF